MTLPFTEFKRRTKILNKVATELNPIRPDKTNSSTNLSTTFTKYIQYTLPYKYISVEAPETFTDVLPISLHLSAHDPRSDVDKLASDRSLSAVHIRNTYGNTLPVDADWLRVANEVAAVLLGLSSRPEVEKIELYQSCPIIIAFAVGMALGTHAGIEVFQWDGREKRYYPVLRLNTLRHGR